MPWWLKANSIFSHNKIEHPLSKFSRGYDWRIQRRKVIKRDNYTCQSCHRTAKETLLHVHHIKPFQLFKNNLKANDLSNLITLCRSCHATADFEFIKQHPEIPLLKRSPQMMPKIKNCSLCNELFGYFESKTIVCINCRIIKCINCSKPFVVDQYEVSIRKFCGTSCSQTYRYRNIKKPQRFCKICTKKITGKEYCIKCSKMKVSEDTLKKMQELNYEGNSTRKIAPLVELGKSTVARWLKDSEANQFSTTELGHERKTNFRGNKDKVRKRQNRQTAME